MTARCTPCHATTPTDGGVGGASVGVRPRERSPGVARRRQVRTQVETQVMPLGNLTQMTPEERAKLVAWAADASGR